MTLVSSIITDAYREINKIALGASVSSNQSVEALRLLQAVITAVLGTDAGELLNDWPLGDYGRQSLDQDNLTTTEVANPPANARLIHTAAAAITVYLPPNPSNGSRLGIADPHSRLASLNVTLDANGRTIEATATVVLSTNSLEREWFYRGDLGDWVRVSTLLTSDQMPFPPEFDQMFIIMLAMRLSPRYGREIDETSVLVWKAQRRQFVARYVQSADLMINDDLDVSFLSDQSYDRHRDISTDSFNRGR